MKRLDEWGGIDWLMLAWSLLLVTVALCAILFGLAETWDWVGKNSSNIASWVQAFGSIAAIAAGFRVARIQFERQRNAQAEEVRIAARLKEVKEYLYLADSIELVWEYLDSLAKNHGKDDASIYAFLANSVASVTTLISTLKASELPSVAAQSVVHDTLVTLYYVTSELHRPKSGPGIGVDSRFFRMVKQEAAAVERHQKWLMGKARFLCSDSEWRDISSDMAFVGGEPWRWEHVEPV